MAAYSAQQDDDLARLQELSNKWEPDAAVCPLSSRKALAIYPGAAFAVPHLPLAFYLSSPSRIPLTCHFVSPRRVRW